MTREWTPLPTFTGASGKRRGGGALGVTRGLETLFAVALVAALAPLVVAILPGPRIPQVVIFLLGGVLIGPHVLGLANTASITLLSNIGLGFLFLLAGYELDPRLLRQRPERLALAGWAVTAVLAVGVVAALGSTGYIHDFVPVGLALTTTALGTLLPILQDNHMLGGKFGAYILAAGAVGELLPTIAISVFLTQHDHFAALASVALVGVLSLRHRAQMTFITATTMPLLIALAEIGKRDGVMLPATSAALVGAGVLSVLIYPPIAVALGRGDRSREQAGADVAGQEGGEIAASG